MKASLKGVLLSGLVFPGAGQIALKQTGRGIALMCAVMVGMAAMIVKGVQIALVILDKLAASVGIIDVLSITAAATLAVKASDSLILNGAFFLILICWVFGVIDAYFIGRKKDNKL
jgi:TM2 domain-containing membrane protein YozV